MHRVVEGERIKLRPADWGFSESELRRRYGWSLDDELQYWSGSIPGGRSYSQFKDTVGQRDWPPGGRRVSYAILTRENELIGMISVYGIEGGERGRSRRGELGIYIGEKRLWGHGYGTDALVAFLRHLFTEEGFGAIYLHTYVSNIRAQRSYKRVGFELMEQRRRYSPRIGYHEEVRMEIDRETFIRLHGMQPQRATML